MTAAARISQADMERATAAAVKAKDKAGAPQARVIMRLAKAEIEIIISDSEADSPLPEYNPWDEE